MQYRYLYGKNLWTLTMIKAWGGWSAGESMDTLLKYVVNEQEVLENYYGDLMSPVKRNRNVSIRDREGDIIRDCDEDTNADLDGEITRLTSAQSRTDNSLNHINLLLQKMLTLESSITHVKGELSTNTAMLNQIFAAIQGGNITDNDQLPSSSAVSVTPAKTPAKRKRNSNTIDSREAYPDAENWKDAIRTSCTKREWLRS